MSPSWARGDKVPTVKYQEYEDRIKALEEELRLVREQQTALQNAVMGLQDMCHERDVQVRTLAERLEEASQTRCYESRGKYPWAKCPDTECVKDRAALDAVNMGKKETRDGGE